MSSSQYEESESFSTTFGANLRAFREQKKLRQEELGQELGKTQPQMSAIENPQAPLKFDILDKIAKVYGRRVVSDLLGLSAALEDVHSAHGFTWSIRMPEGMNEEQRRELEFGLDLFHRLFVQEEKITRIVQSTTYERVYAALKSVFQSAIRFIDIPRATGLEDELKSWLARPELKTAYPRGHLADFTVIDVPPAIEGTVLRVELVAQAASREIFSHIASSRPSAVALGSHYTVSRVAHLGVLGAAHHIDWVPLMSFRDHPNFHHTANRTVMMLADKHHRTQAIYLPYKDKNRYDIDRSWENAKNVLEKVDVAIFTVNGPGPRNSEGDSKHAPHFKGDDLQPFPRLPELFDELTHQERETVAGELLGMLLDDKGELVQSAGIDVEAECRETHFSQFDLSCLNSIARVGKSFLVAAMGYKARATLMCLRKAYANRFIIDREIAEELLQRLYHEAGER